jgi:hypothetical protein
MSTPALAGLIRRFDEMPAGDSYVLSNELGAGRSVSAASDFERRRRRERSSWPCSTEVSRISAQELPRTIRSTPVTDDIYAEHGWTAEVPGVAAHPQEIHRVFHCSRRGSFKTVVNGIFFRLESCQLTPSRNLAYSCAWALVIRCS